MKWLLILALAIANSALVISHHDDDYSSIDKACENEITNDAALTNASSGEQIKCIYKCMLEKTGLVDEQGHYNITNIENFIHIQLTPEQKDGINKCEEKYSGQSDSCQQSWDTAVCVDGVLPKTN